PSRRSWTTRTTTPAPAIPTPTSSRRSASATCSSRRSSWPCLRISRRCRTRRCHEGRRAFRPARAPRRPAAAAAAAHLHASPLFTAFFQKYVASAFRRTSGKVRLKPVENRSRSASIEAATLEWPIRKKRGRSSARQLNLRCGFDVEIVAVGLAEDLPDGDEERRDDRADDESDRAKHGDA